MKIPFYLFLFIACHGFAQGDYIVLNTKDSVAKPLSAPTNLDWIMIGHQIWMPQNLAVSTFRNGDTIPEAKSRKEWIAYLRNRQPAWCYYENDSLNAENGKLYNWFAVNDSRQLAPAGWHIPTGKEWQELYDFLGGDTADVADQMKSTYGWKQGRNGSNSSGFNALPAGSRSFPLLGPKDGFNFMGNHAIWWTSSPPTKLQDVRMCFALYRTGKPNPIFVWESILNGYSVRCIKD